MTGTALVKRATVEELVGHRNAAIAQYKIVADAWQATDSAWRRATKPCQFSYGPSRDFRPDSTCLARFTKELDQAVWQGLLHLTHLDKIMDRTALKAFREQLEKDPPPVTVDNVISTLVRQMEDREKIFARSVLATFDSLPRAYKSNDGFKFGKRIIFNYALTVHGYGGQRWISFYSHNGTGETIHDLDRVFHILDGQEPPTYGKGACCAIEEACRANRPFDIDTEYFRIKGFLAGTLHIWPKRRDLTEKANRLIAAAHGATLPDGRQTR